MGCNICKSVESRKKKKQINCDGSSNNKNKEIEPVNSKKDDKLENKIQLVKNKYNKIKSYIKEVINKENEYYQNIDHSHCTDCYAVFMRKKRRGEGKRDKQ